MLKNHRTCKNTYWVQVLFHLLSNNDITSVHASQSDYFGCNIIYGKEMENATGGAGAGGFDLFIYLLFSTDRRFLHNFISESEHFTSLPTRGSAGVCLALSRSAGAHRWTISTVHHRLHFPRNILFATGLFGLSECVLTGQIEGSFKYHQGIFDFSFSDTIDNQLSDVTSRIQALPLVYYWSMIIKLKQKPDDTLNSINIRVHTYLLPTIGTFIPKHISSLLY